MTANADLLRIAKAPFSLYGILDTSCIGADQFATYAQNLIKGGAGILQIRAKHSNTDERARMASSVLPVAQSASVPLIINDDLDAVLNVLLILLLQASRDLKKFLRQKRHAEARHPLRHHLLLWY